MERTTRHPFKKENPRTVIANPFSVGHIVYSSSELGKQPQEQVIVFNCAWHNPSGSEGRTKLEQSLKPNEVISDGMCEDCERKALAQLDNPVDK